MTNAMKFGLTQADGLMKAIEKKKEAKEVHDLMSVRLARKAFCHTRNRLEKQYPEHSDVIRNMLNQTANESRIKREIQIEHCSRPNYAILDPSAIIILTDTHIPDDVKLVLSFGPKFIFPSKLNIDTIDGILTEMSGKIRRCLPVETQEEAFKQTAIQVEKYMHKYNTEIEKWLIFVEHRVENFLMDNKNIIVTKSDKGNHTVIIDKDTYKQKILQLVKNNNDYIPIDPIEPQILEEKNNLFVNELSKLGSIEDTDEYLDFVTTIAKFYGLIKVHKNTLPARPIVSSCSTPGFKLAGLLTEILNKIYPEKGFHIKNTYELVEKTKLVNLEHDDVFVSFDVVSMFTNISINLMLSIIKKREKDIMDIYKIEWNLFKDMLTFVLRECAVFTFNDQFYKQRDSLAMGSPLSPILAKILMSDIMIYVTEHIKFEPKLCALFVDDSLWIIGTSQKEMILSTLNTYDNKIKFTMELETNGGIDFLDVHLSKNENKVITCWKRKPYASHRILNFLSNHNKTVIVETAKSYIKNVLLLSNDEFFQDNKQKLIDTLRYNCFPEDIIIRLLHENYTLMHPPIKSVLRRRKTYVTFTYHSRFTGQLRSRLKYLSPNQGLTSIPDRKRRNRFSHIKDKIHTDQLSNIVAFMECQCKKTAILNHTEYRKRVGTVIREMKDLVKKGRCDETQHVFNKLKIIKNNSYTNMMNKYETLSHIHSSKLREGNQSNLQPSFKRVLNTFITKHQK